ASFDTAIARLSRAVETDPRFAAAWARLATNLNNSVFLFDADPTRLDRADAAARMAMALDSTLAPVWLPRGALQWNAIRGWHFAEALADYRRGLALQPSNVRAHNMLAGLYFHYGFLPEAERELGASLSLDPRDGCANPTRCIGYTKPRIARVLWYRQQ